jgi:hypothetical protein
LAIAEGKLGKPPGVEHARPDSRVQRGQPVYVEKPVVRQKETRPCQWNKGRKGEQQNPPATRHTTNSPEQSRFSIAVKELESLVHLEIIARPMMRGK